jgi:hypothetical protein
MTFAGVWKLPLGGVPQRLVMLPVFPPDAAFLSYLSL